MIRNSMRSTRLLSWRYLRWAIAIPTLPLVWWACTSHPLEQPTPEPEMQTDVYISVAPNRLLDLVFMVDNSPSMAPKVTKMNAQFPKLIAALKDPNDGTLPDLHVAVIDSDLGTGGMYDYGTSCGPKNADGTGVYGDQGIFQMRTSPTACTFNAGAEFLEVKNNTAVNFTGPADNINTVFACLASNLGTLGCGEEHQLQAFEFALAARGVGTETQQKDFLRANAYLGLVFLSDEDDCSAAPQPNDYMFGDYKELRGDSASLRCATRGHVCSGRNLTTSPPGYPANAPFETAFTDCQARTDTCPNQTDNYATGTDTSVPTDCSPLKNVHHLAGEIKALRSDPENQILVAGIFGWPLDAAAMSSAKYKIALVPNPNTQDAQHLTVYDYWPVCYDPNHMPSAATTDSGTGFDQTAAGWGATGGLRESAFIDEFGANGLKFSICQPDFTKSMQLIGDAIAKKLQNLCVDYKLVDSDVTPGNGLQPDCRVVWRTPKQDPNDPNKVIYDESSTSMPECLSSYSTSNRPPDCDPGAAAGDPKNPNTNPKTRTCGDCWQLTKDTVKCPVNGQLINIIRTASEYAASQVLTPGTKVGMQCRTCTDMTATICATDPTSKSCLACNYTM
jgi:hypothetical protein